MKERIYKGEIPRFTSDAKRNRWISTQTDKYSYAALSKVLGISRQRVHQIDTRNRNRVRTQKIRDELLAGYLAEG